MRVALPLTAAASGTVASISSLPGAERLFEVGQRLGVVAKGHAEDHRVGAACGLGVVMAAERAVGDHRLRAFGSFLRARGVARADRDRHTGAREPDGEPKAKRSGGADDRYGVGGRGWHRGEYRLRAMTLEGKIALVTGGASGIGAATARRLAADGARVAIGDLNEQGAKDVAGELDGYGFLLDVADAASVAAGVAASSAALGEIDVLVNNAGTDRFAFFVNSDEQLWDFVLGVNLRGVLAVTHAVLPGMQQRRVGSIVNVASEAGRVGSQGSAVYSAAKAGVIGFTKAIAREAARYRVRCNAVAPGPIETPLLNAAPAMLGELGERLKQGMVDSTALGRSGEPEEVAAAIAFLAGDEASYVTGQTLNVSGGLSMW